MAELGVIGQLSRSNKNFVMMFEHATDPGKLVDHRVAPNGSIVYAPGCSVIIIEVRWTCRAMSEVRSGTVSKVQDWGIASAQDPFGRPPGANGSLGRHRTPRHGGRLAGGTGLDRRARPGHLQLRVPQPPGLGAPGRFGIGLIGLPMPVVIVPVNAYTPYGEAMSPIQRRPTQTTAATCPAQPASGLTVRTAVRVMTLGPSSRTTPAFCNRKFFTIAPHGPARLGTSVVGIPDRAHAVVR